MSRTLSCELCPCRLSPNSSKIFGMHHPKSNFEPTPFLPDRVGEFVRHVRKHTTHAILTVHCYCTVRNAWGHPTFCRNWTTTSICRDKGMALMGTSLSLELIRPSHILVLAECTEGRNLFFNMGAMGLIRRNRGSSHAGVAGTAPDHLNRHHAPAA
jgi:hypothetical protein